MLIKILLIILLFIVIFSSIYLNKYLVKKSYKSNSNDLEADLRYNLLLISDLVELKNLDKKEFDRSVFDTNNLNTQIKLVHKLKPYIKSKHFIEIYAQVSNDLKSLNESNTHLI